MPRVKFAERQLVMKSSFLGNLGQKYWENLFDKFSSSEPAHPPARVEKEYCIEKAPETHRSGNKIVVNFKGCHFQFNIANVKGRE